MSRTVDEKLRYNEQRNTIFSTGYVIGIKNYRNYPRSSDESKRNIDAIIRTAKAGVKDPATDKDMRQLYKGMLCGFRDAANERKNGKK